MSDQTTPSGSQMNGHTPVIHTDRVEHFKDLGELQKGLAPITSSNLFKTDVALKKPKSSFQIDRFLSHEAYLRQPSSLKASSAGLQKDIISLSTGRPSPDTFPLERLALDFVSPSRRTDNGTDSRSIGDHSLTKETTTRVFVERDNHESSIDLSTALSYGYSLGSEQLIQFLTTHMSEIHRPQYSDWEICLTVGSTSALEIAFRNFANPGDFILAEEYSYSGTIEAAKPLGLHLFPVQMDSDGIRSDSLDQILSSWAVHHPTSPKPKILYTIPTGQNPTGITQPLARRIEVLKVAEKHDLLIIEDDPYYYLYYPSGLSNTQLNLPASYLSLSAQGRVLRLDSTSKILAPGLRLGWLTAPQALVETFQSSYDLGIVQASGLSQVIVYKLLSEAWGHGGFLQWLQSLAQLYCRKASVIMSAMNNAFHINGIDNICTWTPVEAGMFVWITIDCSGHPHLSNIHSDEISLGEALDNIEDEIYNKALEEGVLCCKGSFFTVKLPVEKNGGSSLVAPKVPNHNIHFRLTFASVGEADLINGIERLAKVIKSLQIGT